MSLTKFKNFFLENILDFLWRQWSSLGVAGGSRPEEDWIIDPEALLIFSLQMARYEPRFFDEVLDWLVINGKFIDIQRLRGITKKQDEPTRRLISAVASYLSHEGKGNQRKWKSLSLVYRANPNTQDEALFKTKESKPYPKIKAESPVFHNYGFLREDFVLRKMSKPVSATAPSNVRFLLRALFGIGSRAECILYLLTHEAGHPSEVAQAIGISVRGAQDTLIELAESGLVFTRIKGKRKVEYWFSSKRWWEFLKNMPLNEIEPPAWVNWLAVFKALSGVWNVLNEIDTKDISEYMQSSKLHEAMEVFIAQEFAKSGLNLPPVPGKEVSIEEYAQRFEEFIKRVLGNRENKR